MTVDGIGWQIADVHVDHVRMNQPERTRGESITLECVINGLYGPAVTATPTVFGGPGGTTFGGSDGGTYSTDTSDAPHRRYGRLLEFCEYAGEGSTTQLIGGTLAVHENPQEEWPIDSHIVPIEPDPGVYHMPGFWALIDGYADDSVILEDGEAIFEISLEVTFLADLEAFDSREELLDELSPVTLQYPDADN